MYQLPHDILKTVKTLLAAIHTLKHEKCQESSMTFLQYLYMKKEQG